MKTAVEYLEQAIKLSSKETYNDLVEVIELAKQMEKKQLLESFGMGMEIYAGQPVEYEHDFEEYFNEYYS